LFPHFEEEEGLSPQSHSFGFVFRQSKSLPTKIDLKFNHRFLAIFVHFQKQEAEKLRLFSKNQPFLGFAILLCILNLLLGNSFMQFELYHDLRQLL